MAVLPFIVPSDKNGRHINEPLAPYETVDIDDANPDLQYFGNMTIDGHWYIKKVAAITGGTTIRFVRGIKDYRSSWWAQRASLGYDDIDIIF